MRKSGKTNEKGEILDGRFRNLNTRKSDAQSVGLQRLANQAKFLFKELKWSN